MQLELNEKETTLLMNILQDRFGTMREEVYHADTAAFKDELKGEKEILRGLMRKVENTQKSEMEEESRRTACCK